MILSLCLRNNEVGGEIVLVDGWNIAKRISEKHLQKLASTKIAYTNIIEGKEFCASRPIFTLKEDQQVEICYSPKFVHFVEEPSYKHSDEFYHAIEAFQKELKNKNNQFRLHLTAEDLIIWNNHRIMHKRQGIVSSTGVRHLVSLNL